MSLEVALETPISSNMLEQQQNGSMPTTRTSSLNMTATTTSATRVVRSSSLTLQSTSAAAAATTTATTTITHESEGAQDLGRPEPFDFNLFLEQMRSKSASSIAKYVKSFLREFDKRSWTVTEQIKIIHDFLEFIAAKMRECEVWRNATEHQFENAREGMEKLIMNRLYSSTFCNTTTDDGERDEIVHQKIQIFRWIEERHLDIPHNPHNKTYFEFAQTELLKINSYRAPRDKLICILNCCIVLFGLIRHMEGEAAGADRFLPLLIYVVIKADPEQIVSNIQYISRFRHPVKLESEAGYYLTNLMGVLSFLEKMDASSLSITQEEFDEKVSKTLAEIANENQAVLTPIKNPIPTLAYSKVTFESVHGVSSGTGVSLARSSGDNSGTPDSVNFLNASSSGPKAPVPFSSAAMNARSREPSPAPSPLASMTTRVEDLEPPPPPPPPPSATSRLGGYFRRYSVGSTLPRPNNLPLQPEREKPENVQLKNTASVRARTEKMLKGKDYQQALRTLRDMFTNVDAKVCEVVLQANNGHLPPSIETLLDISESMARATSPTTNSETGG